MKIEQLFLEYVYQSQQPLYITNRYQGAKVLNFHGRDVLRNAHCN